MGRARGYERGVAVVEFSLVLPVLFMLTVGLIDAGRAFYEYNTLSHASRESARFASVWGGSQHPEFVWYDPGNPYNGNRPGIYSQETGYPVSAYVGTPTIVGKVAGYAAGFAIDDLRVTIEAPNGPSWGSPIVVGIDYTFRPATSLLFGGQALTLTASSRMTIE